MICNNCSQLCILSGDRKCLSCQSNTGFKLKLICDQCSNKKDQCCICLKNTKPILKKKSSCPKCGKQ